MNLIVTLAELITSCVEMGETSRKKNQFQASCLVYSRVSTGFLVTLLGLVFLNNTGASLSVGFFSIAVVVRLLGNKNSYSYDEKRSFSE